MKFKVGDIVRVVDKEDILFNNTVGVIASYNQRLDEYLVVYVAVDDAGSEFVYNDCAFPSEVLELYGE